MSRLLFPVFLGAWAWLGILAASGLVWAQHAFYAALATFVLYLVVVIWVDS